MPVTWAEMSKVLPWITVRSGNDISVGGIAIGTSNNVSLSDDILGLFMLQNQVKMTSDDLQQATFNMPTASTSGADTYLGKNALEFYTSFSNPGSQNYSWNSSMPKDTTAFEEGKLAMVISTTAYGQYLRQTYPNLDFGQVTMPQSGDVNSIIDYASYTTYVVPDASPLKDAAQSFVYYLSTSGASTYLSSTKELSSKKSDSTDTLNDRKSSEPSDSQTLTAKSWNKGRYPLVVDSQFRQAIERVVNGSQSAQSALDTAAAAITEKLRKTSW